MTETPHEKAVESAKKPADKLSSLPLLLDSRELEKRAAMVGADPERVRAALATYDNDVGPG